jgi:regulatory protein
MVEITNISCQKNKDKFNLFVDGEFYGGVNKDVAISNNIFVGKKLENQELDKILLESESCQAFQKASDYLGLRLHTISELKTKLYKKGFSAAAIRLTIEKLKEYGYLNDEAFARSFVSYHNGLSRAELQNKLEKRGVDRRIICDALAGVDAEADLAAAKLLAEKYLKNKNIADCKNKLYAFLLRKGFDYSIVSAAIKAVTGQEVEE